MNPRKKNMKVRLGRVNAIYLVSQTIKEAQALKIEPIARFDTEGTDRLLIVVILRE